MAAPSPPLHLFEGFGIELEYAIVDRETLEIRPVCDRILAAAAGEEVEAYEAGDIAWSNELVLHVLELKTNGPTPKLDEVVVDAFGEQLRVIDDIAAGLGVRLLPTGMHPTMDPATQTRLWPHEGRAVYAAYDRVFGCSGHGWANLQSCHLNLPFCGDEEFGILHAAIRAVLPLVPSLAASSPVLEGRVTGNLDERLVVYRTNQRRLPSIIGSVVPEPVWTAEAYQREILEPMYRDISAFDPEGILQHEWLNSRGAIARFERDAIEIRLLDVQETPAADIAVTRLLAQILEALAKERWVSLAELRTLATSGLAELLSRTIVAADEAVLDHVPLLRALGFPGSRVSAQELCTHLAEATLLSELSPSSSLRRALTTILVQGPLARRITRALGSSPRPERLTGVYRALADCLVEDRPFEPL